MAGEKVYPQGIRTFDRNDKAPDFVLGTIVITPNDLVKWLKGEGAQYMTEYQGNKQIRLQATKTKDGRLSLSVDTYKPNSNNASKKPQDDDSLPFNL